MPQDISTSAEQLTASVLDAACLRLAALVPDATYIKVCRCFLGGKGFLWSIDFHAPRRDTRFRVLSGRVTQLHGSGETLEEAIHKAHESAHFNATGKLLPEEETP